MPDPLRLRYRALITDLVVARASSTFPLKRAIRSGTGTRVHAFCIGCIYNSCMSKSITIRNVPDQARNELAARAARQGQSLQEFLRAELIALADRPDNRSLMETIRAHKREMKTTLAAERVLELRDSDRR